MILDSSPVVAILAKEPDSELYVQAISRAPRCRISAGNFVELSIVIEGQFGAEVLRQADALFRRIGIVIEPITVEQAHLARQTFYPEFSLDWVDFLPRSRLAARFRLIQV